ncbi:MAG: hypothetical protein K8T20_17395 [Planctomycetes bacterium]|nr:hypothetical protein [Planctomycetota bacterium]
MFLISFIGLTSYSAVRWNRFCRNLDRDLSVFDSRSSADHWRKGISRGSGRGRFTEKIDGNGWDSYLAACKEIDAMPRGETELLELVVRGKVTAADLETVSAMVKSRWKIVDLLERGADCNDATYRINPSMGPSDEDHPWLRNMRYGLRLLFAVALQRRLDGDFQRCLELFRVQVQIGLDLSAVGYYLDTLVGAYAIGVAVETAKGLVQDPGCPEQTARDLDTMLNDTHYSFPHDFRAIEGSRLSYLFELRRAAESSWLSALPVDPRCWRGGGCARLEIVRAGANPVRAITSQISRASAAPEILPTTDFMELEYSGFGKPLSWGDFATSHGFMRIEMKLVLVHAAAKIRRGWNKYWDRHWPSNPFTGRQVQYEEKDGMGRVFAEFEDHDGYPVRWEIPWNLGTNGGDLALQFPLRVAK